MRPTGPENYDAILSMSSKVVSIVALGTALCNVLERWLRVIYIQRIEYLGAVDQVVALHIIKPEDECLILNQYVLIVESGGGAAWVCITGVWALLALVGCASVSADDLAFGVLPDKKDIIFLVVS